MKPSRNWTPIEAAYYKGFVETCEYFMAQGAKPHPDYEVISTALAERETIQEAKRASIAARLTASPELPSIRQTDTIEASLTGWNQTTPEE